MLEGYIGLFIVFLEVSFDDYEVIFYFIVLDIKMVLDKVMGECVRLGVY